MLIAACVLFALAASANAAAGTVEVPPEIQQAIEDLLDREVSIYDLDEQANRQVFDRIKSWAGNQMDLSTKFRTVDAQGEWVSFKQPQNTNRPIALGAGESDGVETASFNVFFVEETQRRTFRKEIWVPTGESLSDAEVVGMTRRFVSDRDFVVQNALDRLGDCRVLGVGMRRMGPEGPVGDPMTVFQRATCSRLVEDWEVWNSRQIVDIHPLSRELIAYKSLEWTPVKTDSARTVEPVSPEHVMSEIQKAYADEPDALIEEVSRAWHQTSEHLVPVLAIRKRFDSDDKRQSPHDTILVSLVKDMPLKGETGPREEPGLAGPAGPE
jgi:hypothetical protein